MPRSTLSEIIQESQMYHFFGGSINLEDSNIDGETVEEIIEFINDINTDDGQRWSPPKPSSDAYIWRYLNFTQLLSILERDEIWFNKVDKFEDPYEGTLPAANLQAEVDEIIKKFEISRETALNIHRSVRGWHDSTVSGAYVNCWNVNAHQSAALWEQYVDAAEGVAIRTTVDRLQQALEPAEKELTFGRVEYIDYDEDMIPKGNLPAIYHKRESFEHEQEFRISHISLGDEDLGGGFYVDVDRDVLIDRVVISPIAPDWFSNLVERVLDSYDLDCELIESGLYSNPDVNIK